MKLCGVFNTKPLAIVDVETTGASPARNRVIEIAIIRIEQGKVVERFSTVVDPEQHVPPSILGMTCITEQEIKQAPTFAQIASTVRELLADAVFVAHNARFDHAFLKHELSRAGISFRTTVFCTVKLSRFLYPEFRRHDLSTIIERHNFRCERRHRALDDAEVLVDFLNLSAKAFPEEHCQKAYDHVIDRGKVPTDLDPSIIEGLPTGPGVYCFYNKEGELLYVGKSIDIRSRVKSHFAGDYIHGRQLRMTAEVADIKTIETAGEVSALLLESYLIKKDQPVYNRLARYKRRIIVAEEKLNEFGYTIVTFRETEPEDLTESKNILGIFRSLKQAKDSMHVEAERSGLCPVLLGLEKGTSCFWSQLGKCAGACSKKEDALSYNIRFNQAFYDRRVRTWPFNGPVIYTEYKNADKTEGIALIIDDWRLIKSTEFDEAGERPFLPPEYHFDHDSYKILSKIVLNKAKKLKPYNNSIYLTERQVL